MTIALLLHAAALAAPLEAWQGPELGDARQVGVGGAYLALADTGGATLENPASLAVRRVLRADIPTQLDGSLVAIGINLVSTAPFRPVTFGEEPPNLAAQVGGVLKLGPWGLGAHLLRTTYAWDDSPTDPTYHRMQHGFGALGLARAFGGGTGVVGLLAHLHYGSVTSGADAVFGRETERLAVSPSASVGWAWAPRDSRLRFGGRAAAPARVVDGDLDVRWPAEVAVGAAWCTQRNAPATYGEGEAPDRTGRYLLLAADVEVMGPSEGSSIRALAEPAPAGAPTTVSVQLGAEAEVLERRLTLRAGGYNEPGRFDDTAARLHGTGGVAFLVGDLPKVDGFRLSVGADFAQGWGRVAVGFGAW